MIHAYNKEYLDDAKNIMAIMLDIAVNIWHYKIDIFYNMFLHSSYAERIEQGDPYVISGRSGTELAYDVLEYYGIDSERTIIELPFKRSPEYWAGWALAEYQWSCGCSFSRINKEVSIESIVDMYMPYHEMDITQFIDEVNRRRQAVRVVAYLKQMRIKRGYSQSELAKEAGIPLKTIQQYEQRQKSINKAGIETIIALSRVLYCRPEDILEI